MKSEENKMTLLEIISATCKGKQDWIDDVLRRGEINFGCNPNWTYPNMFSAYKVKDSSENRQIGRCIWSYSYLASDGETSIRVKYETDSSD